MQYKGNFLFQAFGRSGRGFLVLEKRIVRGNYVYHNISYISFYTSKMIIIKTLSYDLNEGRALIPNTKEREATG